MTVPPCPPSFNEPSRHNLSLRSLKLRDTIGAGLELEPEISKVSLSLSGRGGRPSEKMKLLASTTKNNNVIGHSMHKKRTTTLYSICSMLWLYRQLFIWSLSAVILWSICCILIVTQLEHSAAESSDACAALREESINELGWLGWQNEPECFASSWLDWISQGDKAHWLIGQLLAFALVFRTNRCYDRWWEGRVLWGRLIFGAIELAQKNKRWIADPDLSERLSNFVIVFACACKAQLRGNCLAHEDEAGGALVERGVLDFDELEDMTAFRGWQPYYALDVLRAAIAESFSTEEGVTMSRSDPARSAAFLALDQAITELAVSIGGAIRVRATGLPHSYDGFIALFVFAYFTLLPLSWAGYLKWTLPVLMATMMLIVNMLIVLGSVLVEPFGMDFADHPLGSFCDTIEIQVRSVGDRHRRRPSLGSGRRRPASLRGTGEKAIVPDSRLDAMLPIHSELNSPGARRIPAMAGRSETACSSASTTDESPAIAPPK